MKRFEAAAELVGARLAADYGTDPGTPGGSCDIWLDHLRRTVAHGRGTTSAVVGMALCRAEGRARGDGLSPLSDDLLLVAQAVLFGS